tara:strand:+ start:546 stop:713 length:168 start_codon:yes stop_codon:yes gene_type:complete
MDAEARVRARVHAERDERQRKDAAKPATEGEGMMADMAAEDAAVEDDRAAAQEAA